MKLGAFSISLAVRNLAASRDFYTKLGFVVVGGEAEQNWLILRNGDTTLGLFHGMFDKNLLTFNPGWDGQGNTLAEFDDVRAIQRHLRAQGVELNETVDEAKTGPAYLTLTDPDGNPILIDQHVEG